MSFLKQNELTTIATKENSLRRLPLWGVTDVQEHEINFEWPKAENLQRYKNKSVPELSAISFWFKDNNTVCLRAVQFDYVAPELNSPLFDTGDAINCKLKVTRDKLKETTSVTACCRET